MRKYTSNQEYEQQRQIMRQAVVGTANVGEALRELVLRFRGLGSSMGIYG